MASNPLLNWAALTLSFFLTILFFWLGLMVLLAGSRRSPGTWLTGGGLLLGALFFTSHTAILGRGLSSTSFGMDFWWWVSWTPAVIAPLAWYSALLWYAGYRFGRPHRHQGWVTLVIMLAVALPMLLIFANPLPSYQNVAGRTLVITPNLGGVPLLILVYLLYSLLCYLLPLDLLRRPTAKSPLEERTRKLAQPYLMGASLALLLAGGVLAWAAFWAVTARPMPSLSEQWAEMTVLRFDVAVQTLIAAAVVLLGRTIVGFEVFTGRALPRNRFFRHWRSTLILAAGFGAITAWTLVIDLRPIYSLMLATALMVLFYALYSWRSFAEREDFMARLRPFLASQNLYGRLTSPQDGLEDSAYPLFETLCRDVLEIRAALLLPAGALTAVAGPPLAYPRASLPPAAQPSLALERFRRELNCLPAREVWPGAAQPDLEWAVGLWSSRGLDGVLLLGEKNNHSPFTEEEIEIAQTAGERMLDLLAGGEMARLTMDLLRRRLAESRVLEGQGRRVLHDEVLPQVHTALLYLSAVQPAAPEVQQAIAMLSASHHRISDLMRDMPISAPNLLSQKGLTAALRHVLEHEYAQRFERVEWNIQDESVRCAGALPLFVNEVIYFAVRELVRNAADHAHGGDSAARICLKLSMSCDPELRLVVEDNGVGFQRPAAPQNEAGQPAKGNGPSKGNGLRIHSAMLAAVGARLEVTSPPSGGTRAVIVFL